MPAPDDAGAAAAPRTRAESLGAVTAQALASTGGGLRVDPLPPWRALLWQVCCSPALRWARLARRAGVGAMLQARAHAAPRAAQAPLVATADGMGASLAVVTSAALAAAAQGPGLRIFLCARGADLPDQEAEEADADGANGAARRRLAACFAGEGAEEVRSRPPAPPFLSSSRRGSLQLHLRDGAGACPWSSLRKNIGGPVMACRVTRALPAGARGLLRPGLSRRGPSTAQVTAEAVALGRQDCERREPVEPFFCSKLRGAQAGAVARRRPHALSYDIAHWTPMPLCAERPTTTACRRATRRARGRRRRSSCCTRSVCAPHRLRASSESSSQPRRRLCEVRCLERLKRLGPQVLCFATGEGGEGAGGGGAWLTVSLLVPPATESESLARPPPRPPSPAPPAPPAPPARIHRAW
jgi:hypothetical protein